MNTHPNSAVVAAIGKRFAEWQAENAAKIRRVLDGKTEKED